MNKDEYIKAVDRLNLWAKAYYTDDSPIASDDEYDQLYSAVAQFENRHPDAKLPYSPTNRIGGEVLDEFKKIV